MRIVGLIVVFTFSLFLHSQAQRFNATVIGGISSTQISGDKLAGFDKAGIVTGAGVYTTIGDRWDLEMQMTYMQKGSRKNAHPDKNDLESYLLRLNYFEIPLLFNYTQVDKMRFEIGPSVGLLLSTFEENQDGGFVGRTQFEDFDLSVSAGMMYAFLDNLYINTRFMNSILPVRDHGSGEQYRLNKGQYNMVLMFALKYYIVKTN